MTKAPATASGDGVLKNDFRQHLSRTCPEQDLRRWFDPLEIIPGEGEPSCCVIFPHAYFAAWFDGSVKELFERQLAAYLGTIPETLSRVLRRFVDEGLISLTGSAVEILDAARLEALAGAPAAFGEKMPPAAGRG